MVVTICRKKMLRYVSMDNTRNAKYMPIAEVYLKHGKEGGSFLPSAFCRSLVFFRTLVLTLVLD